METVAEILVMTMLLTAIFMIIRGIDKEIHRYKPHTPWKGPMGKRR